ncbi:MAG TPA: fluoride efflux transporter CrcB [Longimicrobiales bacterium]|nr:fluoride efflux transporter CrcB [Longimicrobiales bacterium]
MTDMQWIWIGLGGAAGALARWGISGVVHGALGFAIPWGTLLVNVVGCFGLGIVAVWADAAASGEWMRSAVGIGFLGAFTTFSTFSLEAVRLVQDGHEGRAVVYVAASLVIGLLAVMAGFVVARWGLARVG